MNIIDNGEQDDINQAFRDGAELVITKPDYAYVQLGTTRYYFLGKPRTRQVTLFNGEEVTQTILPYDGWEKRVVSQDQVNDLLLKDPDDDTSANTEAQ